MYAELQETYNVDLVGIAPTFPTIEDSSESDQEEE